MRQTKQNGRKRFRKKSTRRLRKKRAMKGGVFGLSSFFGPKETPIEKPKETPIETPKEKTIEEEISELFDEDTNIVQDKLSEFQTKHGNEKTLDFLFDIIITFIFHHDERSEKYEDYKTDYDQKEKIKQILGKIQIIISEISELSDVKKYYCNLAKIFAMRYEYLFGDDLEQKSYFDDLIKTVMPKLYKLDETQHALPATDNSALYFGKHVITKFIKEYLKLITLRSNIMKPSDKIKRNRQIEEYSTAKSEFIKSCDFNPQSQSP